MNPTKLVFAWGWGFIMMLICSSCNNAERREVKYLNDAIINNLEIDESKKWILILPGVGCTGCIQEAEYLVKENAGNNEVIIVLTKISSLKLLQHKLQFDIADYSNIFIDRDNVFDIPTDNSIYPCLVKIKNGSVVSHQFQSPKSGKAFHELKNQI